MNGYRFRSEKYEVGKPDLASKNSGICVSSFDDTDKSLDYYGVIEDIVKITWEGSMELELCLFDCTWFDPTPAGIRQTENLGLVEINHASKLSCFDPFILASQVCQVYYLSYPCKSRQDLLDWKVTYKVPPRGYVPVFETDDSSAQDGVHPEPFFQEEGLQGDFVIDLGDGIDNLPSYMSDEITDPKDLEYLAKKNAGEDVDEEIPIEEMEESDGDEEPEANTYDPNDF